MERLPNWRKGFCRIRNIGLLKYEDALHLQKELVESTLRDGLTDTLLLLEHPPVITIGKSGNEVNLLVNKEMLYQKGISLFYSDRGGDITAHSPGQLVGYLIMDFVKRGLDPSSYVFYLEETIIRTLKCFSIAADRLPGHRGVWIGGEKVCSVGAKFNRSVTSHGFALNVNNDLNYFSYIRPCGIKGVRVTSMSKAMRRQVTIGEVVPLLTKQFLRVFQAEVQPRPIFNLNDYATP